VTTVEDVLNAYVAVHPHDRYQSHWIMSEETAATLRPLRAPDGYSIWTPRMGGGPGEVPRTEHELMCGLPVEISKDAEGFRLETRP